jgi:peptidoglycan/LPS O-acetylase OafA/YrhL
LNIDLRDKKTMKRHFNTFDTLRFLAFLKVFLLHLPIIAFPVFNFLKGGGYIGVIFFFVLSGFLITYIILEEKERTGKLNLPYFMMRRILRIWPLYFLMAGFAYATPFLLTYLGLNYSSEGYKPDWLLTLTFLENYKMIMENNHPDVSPLTVMWTICVEEHFYILWGISLYFINTKRTLFFILTSIILSAIFNFIFIKNNIPPVDIMCNLGYFAFGAIPAYLLVSRKRSFESFVTQIPFFYKSIFVSLMLIYILLSPNISYNLKPFAEPLIFGLLFCSVLCLIVPQNADSSPDKNIVSRLGVFTYGFYLYHTILINFFKQIFILLNLPLDKPLFAVIFVSTTLISTIATGMISYVLFERYFLRLKAYFYH